MYFTLQRAIIELIMSGLPGYVTRYFWGDNLAELSLKKHKKYITKTLLSKGDGLAAGWLLEILGKSQILKLLPTLKLDKKSDNFWKIYLS